MLEHYTEAFVLSNKSDKEIDAVITLFTKDLGKVVAKAKSARKITSKLNGHLQPLNFVNCRIIEKSGLSGYRQSFQIVDALPIDDYDYFFKKNSETFVKFLNIACFINEMTFELHKDHRLWQAIKKIYSKEFASSDMFINLISPAGGFIYHGLLKIIGFDPEHASCAFCGDFQIQYFFKSDHIFLCGKCGGKISKNEVVLIK